MIVCLDSLRCFCRDCLADTMFLVPDLDFLSLEAVLRHWLCFDRYCQFSKCSVCYSISLNVSKPYTATTNTIIYIRFNPVLKLLGFAIGFTVNSVIALVELFRFHFCQYSSSIHRATPPSSVSLSLNLLFQPVLITNNTLFGSR